MTSNKGSLSGLRVIELGAFIAAPFCGQLLADFGADVIKIEPPATGDPLRQWGASKAGDRSLWWPVLARNKKSITLDLRNAEGQDIARRLIKNADVLIENFRPGTLENWNLDPERLRLDNPDLVVTRISGFGQTGPYREHAGFAAVCEAMGGLRVLTGYPDRPPTRVGLSIGDSLAGLFAAFGVLNALYARNAKPELRGQTIDVAITESVLAVMESVISEYSVTGNLRARTGPTLPGIAPSNLYPTDDGSWIIIAANSDGLFCRLASLMGNPELATDPRFATHDARGCNQSGLDQLIAQWTKTRSRSELLAMLIEERIPAGPVYNAADIVEDSHYLERGALIQTETKEFGLMAMQGIVPKLSKTPGEFRWLGPKLGEHNYEVFGTMLGIPPAEIKRLEGEGII
jgi:crotonobetainyl-CoA:carnitine CoA-transferase CaiB-like acyl-CoA transferase